MVGKVSEEDGVLKVQASDLLANSQIHMDADMVVLAAAIEPDESARPLATMLTASMDTNDFFTEAHAKLRPVESPTAGVFHRQVQQRQRVSDFLQKIICYVILVYHIPMNSYVMDVPPVQMYALTERLIM